MGEKHGHHGHLRHHHAIPDHAKDHLSGLSSANGHESSLNLVDLCKDAGNKAKPWLDAARANTNDFGEGLAYGMVQLPIDGTTQLVDHICGQGWTAPKLIPPPEHPNHLATKAGVVTGSVIDTVLVFKGAGLIGGATRLTNLGAGAAVATCSPVPEKDGYWANKAAAVSVGAFSGANVSIGKSCFARAMKLIAR